MFGPHQVCCPGVQSPGVLQFSHRQPAPSLSLSLHRPSSASCSGVSIYEGAGQSGNQVALPCPSLPVPDGSYSTCPRPLSPAHEGQPLTAQSGWKVAWPSAPSPGVPPGPPSSVPAGMMHAWPWSAGPSPAAGCAHTSREQCASSCVQGHQPAR